MRDKFLPISTEDMRRRGWKELDIILISGDAYVDHPSFGAAVIGRVLEGSGFRVGIIAQPDWRTVEAFRILGRPRLFFGITSGNVDSMVANYTANKRPRQEDDYSPGSTLGLRPDRAVIVYANRVREAFRDVPIVLGGIEASMRRLAHYDYWDNSVRRSILLDARGDILIYGMGETPITEIACNLHEGSDIRSLNNIRGTVVVRKSCDFLKDSVLIPSCEEVKDDAVRFNKAFLLICGEQNPFTAKPLVQGHGDRYVIHFPPALPLSTAQLDRVYELPYAGEAHPVYARHGGVKAIETVRFSLISHRGCCGECSFCSLYFHQGRIVQSRSPESLIREAAKLSARKDFRGTITDIGGPTANLYGASCRLWREQGYCTKRSCLTPHKCKNLTLDYRKSIALYRSIRSLPGVNHVFIGSGFRYDLLGDDSAQEYLEELCMFHISGRMKVAPEHVVDTVLRVMNKPPVEVYEKFVKKFNEINKTLEQKCFLVNYFISAHPGATLHDALHLSRYLIKKRMHPEQVQDFIPLPMTVSGCMYHTGVHPLTGDTVYVPKRFTERKMQRALTQYRNPAHKSLLDRAVRELRAAPAARKVLSRPASKAAGLLKK
ncbi:MAG: YgiQ family radical SAM protein [Proteobacteria bacterium]|nr:YgiQ family radical SAM protein [Pseudomonadota bacterium]